MSFYLVEVDGGQINILDSAGNLIDPAKEGGNLADIKTIITAIRDTSGIKKITDALPAGTNELGKIKIIDDDSHQVTIHDGTTIPTGHPGIVVAAKDGTVARFLSLDVRGNLRTSAPIAPSNPQLIVRSTCVNGSGSDDIKAANGSVTPVVFSYNADGSKDINLYEVHFVFSANSIPMGGTKFGPGSALTNGLLVEVVSNGTSSTLATIKVNEEWLSLQPAEAVNYDQTGAADVISCGINLGGAVILKAGATDKVKVTVRDNLSGVAGLLFLKCYVFGVKDA